MKIFWTWFIIWNRILCRGIIFLKNFIKFLSLLEQRDAKIADESELLNLPQPKDLNLSTNFVKLGSACSATLFQCIKIFTLHGEITYGQPFFYFLKKLLPTKLCVKCYVWHASGVCLAAFSETLNCLPINTIIFINPCIRSEFYGEHNFIDHNKNFVEELLSKSRNKIQALEHNGYGKLSLIKKLSFFKVTLFINFIKFLVTINCLNSLKYWEMMANFNTFFKLEPSQYAI